MKTADLLDYAFDELRNATSSTAKPCKICGGDAVLYDMVDFNKACHLPPYLLGLSGVPVTYRQCQSCQFIFTDFFDKFSEAQWRALVYNDSYSQIDPEYLDIRPRKFAKYLEAFLLGRKRRTIGLDYGGGNGKTMSVMRSRGWAFDCYDPFGQVDMLEERKGLYNFCCAMEVFEHTTNPMQSLRDILDLTCSGPLVIMIGTVAHDGAVSQESRLSWWYASPRNGHVSLYSRRSLKVMADAVGMDYVTATRYPHVFLRDVDPGRVVCSLWLAKFLQRAPAWLRF